MHPSYKKLLLLSLSAVAALVGFIFECIFVDNWVVIIISFVVTMVVVLAPFLYMIHLDDVAAEYDRQQILNKR